MLTAYYMDPFDMVAGALADELKGGTLAFDAATGHLKRGEGPCRFCVNRLWAFPEGCAYGKPDVPPYGPDELESAVKTILERARRSREAQGAPKPLIPHSSSRERAMKDISSHIAIAKPKRDLDWLKDALQTAIALEHATMPDYLSATHSLEVQNYTAYNPLRSVAMEEMVHMVVACNILATIGGTRKIKGLAPVFPSYGLPGKAEPDLYVCLAPLSKRLLKNFMRLEAPLSLLDPKFQHEAYPTIARLYEAILDAVRDNRAQIREAMKAGGSSNQVGDDIGFSTFTYVEGKDPLPEIEAAIDEILTQGEGCMSDSLHAGASSQKEETHYCNFAEIYYGH